MKIQNKSGDRDFEHGVYTDDLPLRVYKHEDEVVNKEGDILRLI